jgi:5'-methylthioadenosine/S-adenosylhomocysteine nucleosidase
MSTTATPFKNLLFLAAMDEELDALLAVMADYPAREKVFSKTFDVRARQFELGGGRSVSIARSGVGSVNAALTAGMILEQAPMEAVFLFGVGGALSSGLDIGDLVVSESVVQHDSFSSLESGDHRMRPGSFILSAKDAFGHEHWITADQGLVDLVYLSASKIGGRVHLGTVLSGGEFVGRSERKRFLSGLHPEALLVDMEAAGVAQIASRAGIPFVVAKTVSDRLSPDGSIAGDFERCLRSAAANVAGVMREVLSAR